MFYVIVNIFKMLLALALLLTSLLELHNTYGDDTWYSKTFGKCERVLDITKFLRNVIGKIGKEIGKIKIHTWTVLLFTSSQALNTKKKLKFKYLKRLYCTVVGRYLKKLILQKVAKQWKIINLNVVIIHIYFQCTWMTISNISSSDGLTTISQIGSLYYPLACWIY